MGRTLVNPLANLHKKQQTHHLQFDPSHMISTASPPSVTEITDVVNSLKGKSAGEDGVSVEVYKI